MQMASLAVGINRAHAVGMKTIVRCGWVLAGAIVALSSAPRAAQACFARPNGPQRAHVRADGIVTFVWTCGDECDATTTVAPSFAVQDVSGNTIAGSVLRLGTMPSLYYPSPGTTLWIAWKPASPLVSAAQYDVVPSDPSGNLAQTSFVVGDRPDLEPSTLQVTFTAKRSAIPAGEQVCCSRNVHAMLCYGATSCFQKQSQEVVLLEVADNASWQPPEFEWLYRVTLSADGTSTALPVATSLSVEYNMQTAANEYCYSVDAVDPVSDAVVHVGDGCKTLGITSLAVRAPTEDELKRNLGICGSPPVGYEADWARLGLMTPSTAVASDAGVTSPPQDAGTASPDAGVRDAEGGSSTAADDGGCTLGGAGASSAGWLLALLALARRRSGRESVSA
ncbi:MAG: hypothetical protein JWN04_3033 [Myxococcaceae bacterium]|nr:hypothetical protein [Myxococcaceae bacterium]